MAKLQKVTAAQISRVLTEAGFKNKVQQDKGSGFYVITTARGVVRVGYLPTYHHLYRRKGVVVAAGPPINRYARSVEYLLGYEGVAHTLEDAGYSTQMVWDKKRGPELTVLGKYV